MLIHAKIKCVVTTFLFLFAYVLVYPQNFEITSENFSKLNSFEKINSIIKAPDDKKLELYKKFYTELKTLKQSAIKSNNSELKELIELLDCIILAQNHRYKEALPRLISLLNTAQTLSKTHIKLIYQKIIISYVAIKNVPKAFEYHLSLEAFFTKNNITPGPWDFGINKSGLYAEIGMLKEAILELEKEWIRTHNQYKDHWLGANYLNNKGVYFNKLKKPDSAIACFNQALFILDTARVEAKTKVGYKYFVGLINGNIGQALMHKKKFREAIPLLIEDIKYSNLSGDILNAAISANELAKCYLSLKLMDSCIFFMKKASEWLKDKDNYVPIIQNKQLYAEYLIATKNWKDAALELIKINQLKDSVLNKERESQAINHQVAYSVSQKIEELAQKDKIIQEEEAIIQKESNRRRLLVLMVSFLCTILIIILYSYYKLKKSKLLLAAKNKLIENNLREKDFLIKEVHHRVKNNLQVISSLLSLQISKTNKKEIIENLNETKQRINSIGQMHEFLYQSDNLSLIKMPEYIDKLVENINSIYENSERKIHFESIIDSIAFDLDTALPLGLLLNELISNSFKHAFKNKKVGRISINLRATDTNEIALIVADDGKGIDKSKQLNSQTLGMEIIYLMSQQLGNSPIFENQGGTKFILNFRPSKLEKY